METWDGECAHCGGAFGNRIWETAQREFCCSVECARVLDPELGRLIEEAA